MQRLKTSLWFLPAVCTVAIASMIACSDDDPATSPSTTNDAGSSSGSSGSSGTSGAPGDAAPAATKDIVDTAVSAGSFGTLVSAVQAAGLESTLRGPGPFTVFAPNDAAFAKVPKFLLDKLVTPPYKTTLATILKYHVLAGNVKAPDILGKELEPATAAGTEAKLKVSGANSKVVVNGAFNVTTPDIGATNGTIHVIDGVMLPTIADYVVHYDDGTTTFKTLLAALSAADLATVFDGAGTFTVFAPSDAAFAKIPKATLDALIADKPALTAVLKNHVVGSAVYEKDVSAGDVTALEGMLTISIVDGKPEIGKKGSANAKSKIIFTDVPASNGVVHVIDTVIL